MSLIDQASDTTVHKLRMSETAGKKKGPPRLMQTAEFLSIIRSVFDENLIDKKTKKEWKGYRSRLKKSHWPLEGVMGKVDEMTWNNMCEGALKAMVKNIRHTQPNGEWRLGEYEVDIRPNLNGDESIVVACSWIDSLNKQDLRYQNGVPAVDIHINTADGNKELIEALTKKNNSSNDEELKDLMRQFITVMAGKALDDTNAAQAEEVTEKPTSKPDEFDEDLSKEFDG